MANFTTNFENSSQYLLNMCLTKNIPSKIVFTMLEEFIRTEGEIKNLDRCTFKNIILYYYILDFRKLMDADFMQKLESSSSNLDLTKFIEFPHITELADYMFMDYLVKCGKNQITFKIKDDNNFTVLELIFYCIYCLQNNLKPERLIIACSDFGFTIEELNTVYASLDQQPLKDSVVRKLLPDVATDVAIKVAIKVAKSILDRKQQLVKYNQTRDIKDLISCSVIYIILYAFKLNNLDLLEKIIELNLPIKTIEEFYKKVDQIQHVYYYVNINSDLDTIIRTILEHC